jgi:pseudouridylate synthase
VHRDAGDTFDESADLVALARTGLVVVCAGVKSILDVAATLERLETLGIAVVGYRTATMPGFYVADTGLPLPWRVDSPAEVAEVVEARASLGLDDSALVVANPVPVEDQLDPALHDRALTGGLARAREEGVRGAAVTPFVLDHLHRVTAGASLAVNAALVRHNARLAARVAVAVARHAGS